MAATFVPHSWSSPVAPTRGEPWVFGREVSLSGLPGNPRVVQWLQKRNCSITPRQMGLAFGLLCSVSLLIAVVFFLQGAPFVLAFAGAELLAVGAALVVFARHAGDRETLTLVGRLLRVEQRIGSRVEKTEFVADWLSVEPAAGQGSLIELSGRGKHLRVGRFLHPDFRAAFARELRQALRRPACGPEAQTDPNPSKPR
jgi:uncharacterized membrane protein